ncbi:uncharacterized protein BN759_02073 [Bacteroides sp. CAG:702]|nr:uncharacterized protein BN759_02073 [Bacteroides sp. CAG:702]
MKEKKLTISGYGIFIMSVEKLMDFLKKNKRRSKKILDLFQNNPELYFESLKEGVWIPIVPIDSYKYVINNIPLDDEWQKIYTYENFNLHVLGGEIWIGSFGHLLNINIDEFKSNDESISYKTLDGILLYDAFKLKLETGKYLVNITGYKRKKILEYPEANSGFSFKFEKVDEFIGYNDPREDDKYHFNLLNS